MGRLNGSSFSRSLEACPKASRTRAYVSFPHPRLLLLLPHPQHLHAPSPSPCTPCVTASSRARERLGRAVGRLARRGRWRTGPRHGVRWPRTGGARAAPAGEQPCCKRARDVRGAGRRSLGSSLLHHDSSPSPISSFHTTAPPAPPHLCKTAPSLPFPIP